jgi:ubiquinone/menaquinone biosynthesis C-methylase UbiE
MMRRLILVVSLFASACTGVAKLDLTTVGRETWQRPDDVIASLDIEPGSEVADIGAGEGYFVPYLLEAVGPQGRVYAVDVEAEKIDRLREELGEGQDNLEIILGDFDNPLLPDRQIDLVLIVNTYHHVEKREDYFRRLQEDLASGGRVAILEPNADLGGVLSLGLKEDHASSAAEVRQEMEAAGYRSTASIDRLPVQIFEIFEVESAPDPSSQ